LEEGNEKRCVLSICEFSRCGDLDGTAKVKGLMDLRIYCKLCSSIIESNYSLYGSICCLEINIFQSCLDRHSQGSSADTFFNPMT